MNTRLVIAVIIVFIGIIIASLYIVKIKNWFAFKK